MLRLKIEYITIFLMLMVALVGVNFLEKKVAIPIEMENTVLSSNAKNYNLKVIDTTSIQAPVADQLSLDKLLERPLFSQTRKPRDPSLAAAHIKKVVDQVKKPVKVVEKKEIVLRGIFKKENFSEALISISEAKAEWYRVKDIIEGWQIEQINNDEVIMSRDEETRKIKLYNF